MIHQDKFLFIEFCVDMNETENCRLKMEVNQRIMKAAEGALLFLFLAYYGWFLGRHLF